MQEVLSVTTLAVVALGGPLACLVFFVVLCIASDVSHKVVGRMPNAGTHHCPRNFLENVFEKLFTLC